MHAAPSVSYPVGRSAFAARAAALAALAGAAAAGLFVLQSDAFGWRQALVLGAVGAASAFAWAAWLRSPTGVLRWDGADWRWEAPGSAGAGRPQLALDLQARLLLRWQPDGGRACWLWLERESDSAHWEALRRAVYSRARAPVPTSPPRGREGPPAGGPPPAAEQ